jgi:hypothetical protein
MKVRVSYVVEIDDNLRRMINEHYGRPGLASREQVKRWYMTQGTSSDDDLSLAYQQAVERGEEEES